VLTLIIAAIVAGVAAFLFVKIGMAGFSAKPDPGRLETWLAYRGRDVALPSSVKKLTNPVADSPEVQKEARAHWADHCAVCHANNGSGDTMIGRGLYPRAPDMRARTTQQRSDGELFWDIENGVRMTGMPAWGGTDAGQDSWKLVRFIRHLPELTPTEEAEMEKLNPKSPDDKEEEQNEEDFLKGGEAHEQHSAHHH
jgi:mono/diheme cytochrome c family protein